MVVWFQQEHSNYFNQRPTFGFVEGVLRREFFIRHACTDDYGDCCIFLWDVGQELGDVSRVFFSSQRACKHRRHGHTLRNTRSIFSSGVLIGVWRFVSCLFEYGLYRSVIVSLFLSLSFCCESLRLCMFYERVRVSVFVSLSRCRKKRHHATSTLHRTTDGKSSFHPRRLIITYAHGEQGTASSVGAFNFQTAIVVKKCYFCRVFSRWIVILSTDIRLGVKNRGFYFSLKIAYSTFN